MIVTLLLTYMTMNQIMCSTKDVIESNDNDDNTRNLTGDVNISAIGVYIKLKN